MESVEAPIVINRPSCLNEVGGKGDIIECVNYYITLLISYAPAELMAEYEPDGKSAIWIVRSIPDYNILHTETMASGWFRMCLARIAFNYMKCSPYGGYCQTWLTVAENKYRAVFYLANEGLSGFWFKGRCGSRIEPESGQELDLSKG